MKIISVRSGFASDHSSTSYEFLAVDQPWKRGRAAVASLSSERFPLITGLVLFIMPKVMISLMASCPL